MIKKNVQCISYGCDSKECDSKECFDESEWSEIGVKNLLMCEYGWYFVKCESGTLHFCSLYCAIKFLQLCKMDLDNRINKLLEEVENAQL